MHHTEHELRYTGQQCVRGIPRGVQGGIVQGVVYLPYPPGRHVLGYIPTIPTREAYAGLYTLLYPPGRHILGYTPTIPTRIPGLYHPRYTLGTPLMPVIPPRVHLSCPSYHLGYTFHTLGIPPRVHLSHPGYTSVFRRNLCAEWSSFLLFLGETSAQSGLLSPWFFGRIGGILLRRVLPF